LAYTPDLAPALDAAALTRLGIAAAPLALADMAAGAVRRGRAGPIPAPVYLVSTAALAAAGRTLTAAVRRWGRGAGPGNAMPALVLVGDAAADSSWRRLACAVVPRIPEPEALSALLWAAQETARLRGQLAAGRQRVQRARRALAQRQAVTADLQNVAIALSAEHDAEALQTLILARSRALTCADAGSLYLVEGDSPDARRLRFQLVQNDSLAVDYHRTTLPLSAESLAGYTALTGQVLRIDDAYALPADVPYRFNRAIDAHSGYRTRSLLLVPMVNHAGEVVGVIQLINRKRSPDTRLDGPDAVARAVVRFDAADERLARSFASQAAVALDNQRLLASIAALFDGFVHASVQAIEARDPTTAGHSQRVATLSVALAEAVTACGRDRWADVGFSPLELRELRYAGLLHDFGKVGVREPVLLKERKLYDWQLRAIEDRFAYARAVLTAQHYRTRQERAGAHAATRAIPVGNSADDALSALTAGLEQDLAVIRAANEPTVLAKAPLEHLYQLGARRFADLDGQERRLLEADELALLTIARGSLDEAERREIESHVTHTIHFLSLIPWTKDLRNIVRIAGAHHEKLNGRGYPYGLSGDAIPLQSRIMAIADVYDALTASDRPYKRAVSTERALRILHDEAAVGYLDADLLDLFTAQALYEVVRPGARAAP
jgi:HD-GYP domain-containing protein (c-di-GMP phosphodiesterase class II)